MVKANVEVKVASEDKSNDFSKEEAATFFEPDAQLVFDRAAWESRIRSFTAAFARHAEIIQGHASVTAEVETRRYVNTEGSEIKVSSPLYRLIISASSKAEDGMELPLHRTYMSFDPAGLPDEAAILRDVNQVVDNLLALRKAPVAEPFTGPAILSGRASAVFFHEIFGHRIEAQRQKQESEAQTFKKHLNQPVLPEFLSVYSDPTLRTAAGSELVGYYPYDDEGVKARRVTVVDHGVLKNFLMSRTPIEAFSRSNGLPVRRPARSIQAKRLAGTRSAERKFRREFGVDDKETHLLRS